MWRRIPGGRKGAALAAFIGLLVLAAVWPSSVPVDVAEVQRGPLEVTVDEEGETRVRERFVISAPVAGRVLRIDLEPGDPVVAGETLLAIFQPASPTPLDARASAEARAALRAAEAALGRARAERERVKAEQEFATSELERSRQLSEQQIVSREALEASQTRARSADEGMRAADFAVASAEHERDMARARLLHSGGGDAGEAIRIVSPVDGEVLKRMRWSESVVPAGEPLLELGDPAQIEIVSDMLSSDAVQVSAGDLVHVEEWGGDEPLEGRVRRVEPSGFTKISALGVEEQRVNVIVDLEEAEAARALGDAYRVELRVVVWSSDDVLKLPVSSLFRSGDGWAAFVMRGGRARQQVVEIGHRNGLEAEVLAGVDAGEPVLLHPSDAVEDGARVSPRG